VSEATPGEALFARLRALLDQGAAEYRVMEHEPTYTSEESARVRGVGMHAGAKALLVKGDDSFALLVLPADFALDSKSARAALGARRLRFATVDEVRELTGLAPGAIPPFGSLFGLPTVCDPALAECAAIYFNAALHDRSIELAFRDWVAVERPRFASLGRRRDD
jgi:Ala-tRNA(Pro) deacylase